MDQLIEISISINLHGQVVTGSPTHYQTMGRGFESLLARQAIKGWSPSAQSLCHSMPWLPRHIFTARLHFLQSIEEVRVLAHATPRAKKAMTMIISQTGPSFHDRLGHGRQALQPVQTGRN